GEGARKDCRAGDPRTKAGAEVRYFRRDRPLRGHHRADTRRVVEVLRGDPGLPRQEAVTYLPEKFCFVVGVVPRFSEGFRFRRSPNRLAKNLASKNKLPCVVVVL